MVAPKCLYYIFESVNAFYKSKANIENYLKSIIKYLDDRQWYF